ncbi:MAG: hypothetical protein WA139_01240 [Candidatus Aenigmatarchaeota archaeon]
MSKIKNIAFLFLLIGVVIVSGCVNNQVSTGNSVASEQSTQSNSETTNQQTTKDSASSIKNTEMLQTTNPIKVSLKENEIWSSYLYGNYFAFSNERNQKDVYLYDIINQKLEQITKDLSDQEIVDISNNKILYKDYRFVTNRGSEQPLYALYDITSKATENLEINKSLDSNEKISKAVGLTKDFAVFIIYSETLNESFYPPGRIYNIKFIIYNLDKKTIEKFQIELSNSLSYVYKSSFILDKDSNKILSYFLNESSNSYEIKIYNIENKKLEKAISFPKTYAANTKEDFFLNNNKIVYSDNRDGKDNYDIFLYDLTNDRETQITNTADILEKQPSIYDNIIVYRKLKPNQDSNLMKLGIFDISSNKEIEIANDCHYFHPQIYGKNIIWQGWDSCSSSWPLSAVALSKIK